MSTVQRLYGLRISSDLPIYGFSAVPPSEQGAPEVRVLLGPPMATTSEPPSGTVIAHFVVSETLGYTFVWRADGAYVLRYFGVCDFVVDSALTTVTVRIVDGSDPDMASVLLTGSVPSFLLAMQGEPVLHASAVDVGGHALAFVGHAGMGKSTMAALTCAAGGRLITDDVLRLDLGGPAARCYLGGRELRLRKSASELADRFDARPSLRVTADDREALAVLAATDDLLPLTAIVLPRPDRSLAQASISRLSPVDALLSLVQFPRLVGWEDPVTQGQQFQHLGAICERVPVHVATVPWGPPFAPGLAEQIFEAVDVPSPRLSHKPSPGG